MVVAKVSIHVNAEHDQGLLESVTSCSYIQSLP